MYLTYKGGSAGLHLVYYLSSKLLPKVRQSYTKLFRTQVFSFATLFVY